MNKKLQWMVVLVGMTFCLPAFASNDRHFALGARGGVGAYSLLSVTQMGAGLAYTFGNHFEIGANYDSGSVSVIFGGLKVGLINAGMMYFYTADFRYRTEVGHGFSVGPTFGSANFGTNSGPIYGAKMGYDFSLADSLTFGLQGDYYPGNDTLKAPIMIFGANLKVWI